MGHKRKKERKKEIKKEEVGIVQLKIKWEVGMYSLAPL
jgi:hypothetical protein